MAPAGGSDRHDWELAERRRVRVTLSSRRDRLTAIGRRRAFSLKRNGRAQAIAGAANIAKNIKRVAWAYIDNRQGGHRRSQ
jgi:hypothetical protein